MCIPSNSYVCLAINPKQHCQTSTTEIVKINTKGLGREILRSPREGNFKGVSWKLGVINHHGLKEKFRNCIMPFAWLKIMESWWKRQEKKNQWKNSQTFMFKEKASSKQLTWWEQKCRVIVPSRLVFGIPLAWNGSVILKAIIYTRLVHIRYIIYIFMTLRIKGQ